MRAGWRPGKSGTMCRSSRRAATATRGIEPMTTHDSLGGRFTLPGTALTVSRVGFGAMQLPGPHVWGPPKDQDQAIAVLREAVELGINHIDTSDFYGPHVANKLIREALHPYP